MEFYLSNLQQSVKDILRIDSWYLNWCVNQIEDEFEDDPYLS